MKWIAAVARRIEMFLRIAAKLSLLVPILLGMMLFSYRVDPSGLFRAQQDLVQLEAAALLEGQALAGYDQLSERKLMAAYVEALETAPETIALGSSRVLQLRQTHVGGTFYNCGMSGADFYDLLGTYYLFERAGMLPENIIISLDAWLFNSNEDAYSLDSDKDLYDEFLNQSLGYDNGWQAEPEVETGLLVDLQNGVYDALFDPSYFQASLQMYDILPAAQTDTADVVTGDYSSQLNSIKLSDGSIVYGTSYSKVSQEEINKRAVVQAGTFVRMEDFYQLDTALIEVFERFIQHVQAQGVNVIFVMVPYHPAVYNYATENAEVYPGFFAAQEWYVQYAEENDIPLYGSYNPFVAACDEADFYDGLHVTQQALERLLPTMAQIKAEQQQGQAGSDWLYSEAAVTYEVAQQIVAERYEISSPEVLVRDADQEIYNEACYILQRWDSEGDTATLLAWYAVSQNEGIIYRLDTQTNTWVVDARYG